MFAERHQFGNESSHRQPVIQGGCRWNPAIEDQAINRAHRIGCKSQVIVTRFISKDTIEERIDKVLTEKRELFAAILGDGDDTNVTLSMNASEIFGLFDLKARHGKGTRVIGPKPVV